MMHEQQLIGTIIEWVVNQIVGVVMGAVAGAAMPMIWRHIRRRRSAAKISEAYYLLQVVCEPGVLNPNNPGNPEYMKARARDCVNLMTRQLEKAGFFPPPRCTTENDSLQEWYRFIENARIMIE